MYVYRKKYYSSTKHEPFQYLVKEEISHIQNNITKIILYFRDIKGDFIQVEKKLRSAVEAMKEVNS